jgi:hypothetical protein
MKKITFPPAYDNEAAHRQVKLLMMQRKRLHILVYAGEVYISCQKHTGLRYQLNDNSWKWIVNYLRNGDYEDFGVFPSKAHIANGNFEEIKARELIEQKNNIATIPFHRETEAVISLRVLFKYGKLYFNIRRTDDFIDYLIDNKLW